jgi:hypothetical protein
MKINIEGAIDILFEIGKISSSNRFFKQFGLDTGYASPKVTITTENLNISEKQRGLLVFLGITHVTGESGMEYNNYEFVSPKKTYIGHDYNYGNKAESTVNIS